FPGATGPIRPVRGVSFRVGRGQALGVVGESGSGKSLTALAIAQLVEEPGRAQADRLRFAGQNLLHGSDPRHRERLLPQGLVIVFEDSMTSFTPGPLRRHPANIR